MSVAPFEKLLGPDRMNTDLKVALIETVNGETSILTGSAALELPKLTWNYHHQHKVDYATLFILPRTRCVLLRMYMIPRSSEPAAKQIVCNPGRELY